MKVGRHGRRKSGVQQSLSKGLRPTHQAVTKEATASNGKTMIRYYARPVLFIVPAAMATFEAFGMSLTDRATMFNSCAVWGTKNREMTEVCSFSSSPL